MKKLHLEQVEDEKGYTFIAIITTDNDSEKQTFAITDIVIDIQDVQYSST